MSPVGETGLDKWPQDLVIEFTKLYGSLARQDVEETKRHPFHQLTLPPGRMELASLSSFSIVLVMVCVMFLLLGPLQALAKAQLTSGTNRPASSLAQIEWTRPFPISRTLHAVKTKSLRNRSSAYCNFDLRSPDVPLLVGLMKEGGGGGRGLGLGLDMDCHLGRSNSYGLYGDQHSTDSTLVMTSKSISRVDSLTRQTTLSGSPRRPRSISHPIVILFRFGVNQRQKERERERKKERERCLVMSGDCPPQAWPVARSSFVSMHGEGPI